MAKGPPAKIVTPYFQHLRLPMIEGLVLGEIELEEIQSVTAEKCYDGYSTTSPPPKVIYVYVVYISPVQ